MDTSMIGMFLFGAAKAVACWKSGCTIEDITHTATRATPKDRGVIAACEVMLGWQDIGAREARAHGMTREEADAFVVAVIEAAS